MIQLKPLEAEKMRRFSASTCQVLMCLLLTFACSLRAASTVYVGVGYGLLKSTDAGATWNLLNVPLNSPFLSGTLIPQVLAMDPQNPSKIYFIGRATGYALFASPDGGATWSNAPFIGMQPTNFAVDFGGQAIYLAASATNGGPASLYKSTNTGASWTPLTAPSSGAANTATKVFADSTVAGTVYVVWSNHFFKSTDFGTTWKQIDQQAGKLGSYVDPHNPSIWYDIYTGSGSGVLFKSTDGGATYTQLNPPTDKVDGVSVGASSSTIYVIGDVAGLGETVVKSTDGGASWTALKNGLVQFGVVWADPVDPSTVFINDHISPRNFYVSTDGGAHFTASLLPQGPPGCVPGNCAVPNVTDLLFAASVPSPPVTTSVVSGASFQPGVVANSWVTIQGSGLAPKTDDWSNAIVNGALPTSLDGVSVTMGGKPAYIYYISPGQINVLAPDLPPGPVTVTVTTAAGTSAAFATTASAYGPAFFAWPSNQAVATRTDYSFAVKPGTFAGATTVAAKPGDVIILWATGFGPTNPVAPPGVATPGSGTYSTASTPTIKVNNIAAIVYGAALAPGSAGLYQIAIQVPSNLADGDWPIQASIGGITSPAGTILSVHQ